MTNAVWTRKMYQILEEDLRIKKKPLDAIAEGIGVKKKDLTYRIQKLNEGKDYLTLWEEEFVLLETCKNVDIFIHKFRGLYGYDRTIDSGIFHWNHRDQYLKKWHKEKKPVHNVQPPNVAITTPITPSDPDAILDESDIYRKIYDVLVELLHVQKDTYTLFKTLNDRAMAAAAKTEKRDDCHEKTEG